MQPDEAIEPVVVREPDALKGARPVLWGGLGRETQSLPSPLDPLQALQTASRPAGHINPGAKRPRLLLCGATGATGNAVLRQLVGAGYYASAHVVAREPLTLGLRNMHALCVPPGPIADASHWPVAAADVGVVMFDPPRLYYDRERVLWTPAPADLPAVAAWMQRCGVTTLAVVMPHEQGRLPQALREGLASVDEHAVAAQGFARVLLVRTAQKPGASAAPAGRLPALAHWMLSVFQYMVPAREQPVRTVRVAEFVGLALQLAPPGIHVAGPEWVWRAAQQDVRSTVQQWLAP